MMMVLFSFALSFASPAAAVPAKTVVGYFSKEPSTAFESKIRPLFEKTAEKCETCELRNLTPYNEKGEFDAAKLAEAVNAVPDEVSFLLVDWNERATDKNQPIVDAFSKRVAQGQLVVAAAGVPPTNEGSCPLNRTTMGKVGDSLIIGELMERDRLLPLCYYGPEMLSAIRPPKELMGQGYAPLVFAAHLASQWRRRSPQDWASYLRARKAKTKRIWVELDEFFPR